MKKLDKKKINYFRVFLFLLLGISIILYLKIYILDSNISENVIDLPKEVTDNIWYEYDSLNTIKFSSGHFEYGDEDSVLNSCNKYFYSEKEKIINFDCKDYSMKLVSVSKYKLVLMLNGTNIDSVVYTYYSSLDLVNYLIDNNIKNMTDEDIESIMDDNGFSISKVNNSVVYKNAQLSKLSSINELSIDDYISLKYNDSKAIVFLINPNMSVEAYDLIPIFISWKDKYDDYDFYYVDGSNLTVNDSDLLNRDKVLKDYLTGLYENNILIFSNNSYRRINVYVPNQEESDTVFNCMNEECDKIELIIYDSETVYDNLDDILD